MGYIQRRRILHVRGFDVLIVENRMGLRPSGSKER